MRGSTQQGISRQSTRYRSALTFACTVLVLAAALTFAGPASAKKTRLFVETFGSAAQPTFQSSNALALDPSSGDLLVVDAGGIGGSFFKGTVGRYHADGTPSPFSALGTNVIDAKGNGECPTVPADCDQTPQNGFPHLGSAQIAVDDSSTLTDGNIYVTEADVFGQGLISPADRITIFASDGHYLGQLTKADGTPMKDICGVAVDPDGSLYLAEFRPSVEVGPGKAESPEGRIYKFDPSANPPLATDHVATFTPPDVVCELAAGAGPSAGSLFAAPSFGGERDVNGVIELDATSGSLEGVVTEEDANFISVDPVSGHVFVRSTSGSREFDVAGPSSSLLSTFPGSVGIAANAAIDRVYVSPASGSNSKVLVRGPIVTVPEAATGSYEINGDTSVQVKGTVDPDGQALTECFFEYDTDQFFETSQTAPCEAPNAAEVGTGTGAVAVHADLTGLSAETLYHYRLLARNANAALYPNDPDGTARGKDQTFKTPSKPAIKGVWATNVILTEATLKATLNPENSNTTYRFEWGLDSSYGSSTAEIALGAGDADHTVGLTLTGLEPATTYHYRIVATNSIGVGESADHRFTTFPVSTPPAGGCANDADRIGHAALLPDCRAYELVSPIDKDGGDILVLTNGLGERTVLEQSSLAGERLAYGSVRSFGDAASAPFTSQYIAQRLAGEEWRTHSINSPRGRPVVVALAQINSEFKAFSADLCDAWQVTFTEPPLAEGALAGYENLYRRADQLCSEDGDAHYEALAPLTVPKNIEGGLFFPLLQGVSADGTHAIFTANAKLAAGGSNAGARQLYESVRGEAPRFACFLPGGGPQSGTCTGGRMTANVDLGIAQAISDDGERIFWVAPGQGEGKIYVRIGGTETVAVSQAGENAEGTSKSAFWDAAADGSVAIFSTGNAALGEATLYEFDVDAKTTTPIAEGGVSGVMGIGDDAERVYFVSSDVLTGEETNGNGDKAQAGKPNLYLRDGDGGIEFIGTLASADLSALGFANQGYRNTTARVSADGAHTTFTSTVPLTGYDNIEAEGSDCPGTGGTDPCLQIYRYDAEADELLCVSCNPSGARPVGDSAIPSWQTPMHAARVLAEDGSRLYFESGDALVPRDSNGAVDVYQWQEPGAGTCTLTSPTYSTQNDGCLDLVSSGQNHLDSRFVEASPTGEDVFFATASSLLPQDPGGFDIYDARVNGGLPIPTGPPPGCEGEACQSPPEPPNDPTPASSSFEGAGNVVEGARPRPRCTKGKVRRRGRCVPSKHRKVAKRANRKRRTAR